MKDKITRLLVIAALSLTCGVAASGRQSQPKDVSVNQLREEIAKLEAVENDPSTPPEVRELNRSFLQQRRRQLNALLQTRAASLRQYLSRMKGHLTPDEVKVVERSIDDLEQGLSAAETTPAAGLAGRRVETPAGPLPDTPASALDAAPVSTVVAGPRPAARATDPAVPRVSSAAPILNPAPAQLPPVAGQEFPTPKDCSTFNASPNAFSLYDRYVCTLIEETARRKANGDPPLGFSGPEFFYMTVILVSQKLRSTFLVEAEEARVDKQIESPSSSSGSTSLVTKGGTPAILGLAVENGALEREVSGTTITFRGNPVGIVETLAGKGLLSGYEDDSPSTRFLRKTSFSFSFDTDRGASPGIFLADRQQLSSVSARFEFINRRDPRSDAHRTDWQNFLATRAQPFLSTFVNSKGVLVETIQGQGNDPDVDRWKDPALQAWFEETQSSLVRAAPGNVEAVFKAQLTKLPLDELSPDTVAALTAFARQFGVYVEGRQRVLDKVARGTVATFEFVNNREVNAPDTSNFKGIYETSFGGRADFTFNGSLTLFNKRLAGPGLKRVRDFQFAAQLDLPFGDPAGAGQFVFSGAAKYERLLENASTQAGTFVPGTKGDIVIGQLKLVIPIKTLGVRFPISATFANRTELIKEREIRGNFGFTFDFDSILARFKPF
ncbi:MAG TPA: hypothetical protein VD968_07795 [Pyrinomonadaceae bacterium]|nr:hypothetical protein [Pyrinomonadaceae bacterium]